MNLLKTLYEIHSPSGNEKAMKKFIRGCVKMMHPLFRYRTIGFSFFIEYDSFFPVSMLSGGIICRRWFMPPLYFDNFCLSSSHS